MSPVTIIRDRPPRCRTCRRPLTSWYFGADDDSERCERCQERAFNVSMRAIVHDFRMAMRHPKAGRPPSPPA